MNDAAFEAASQNKQVQLKVAADVELSGDAELLSSALEKVVRNAVAYTPEAATVQVSLTAGEGRCIIRVLDQGPGVSEAALTD